MTDPNGGTAEAGQSGWPHQRLVAQLIEYWRDSDPLDAPRASTGDLTSQLQQVCADPPSARHLARMLDVAIADLDRRVAGLLDAILHNPRFQKLEAVWRGVQYLVEQVTNAEVWLEQDGELAELKIRILQVTKEELYRDFTGALEIDQSVVWHRIYEQEFGVAGGAPFGVLIGDYEFSSHPRDVMLLESLGQVAAASFAPFIAAASPQLFQVGNFQILERQLHVEQFDTPDFIHWRRLRQDPNMRFVGLTLPRILLRYPHDLNHWSATRFYYEETVRDAESDRYLWGNAAFAFAGVLTRAFAQCGWFADIRGMTRGVEGGGLVTGLPAMSCPTDGEGVMMFPPVEVLISDQQEAQLASQGFIPLCSQSDSSHAVFYANPSLHKPQRYDDTAKTENEQLSSMLQYVLCTARIAHHLKRLGRTWLGASQSAYDLTNRLDQWIMQYVVPTDNADPYFKAKHPLRSAEVEVVEEADNPGAFRLIMRLQPHYQLDGAMVRLETRIISPDTA